MKTIIIASFFLLAPILADSQGFVIDQQSTNLTEGVAYPYFNPPVGQSFRPSLAAIGFVTIYFIDGDFQNTSGGTVYLNLRSNSITGTIMATSTSAFVPDAYFGTTNFFFNSAIAVNPGTTYYIEPVIQSGNLAIGCPYTDGSYTGGSLIRDGLTVSGRNLWFQEGVIGTPEPSSLALLVLGGSWLFSQRKRRRSL
jgi:hypothetical protein